MPVVLARIGEYTPLAATQQTLYDAWGGAAPQPVLLASTMILCAVAVRIFRWQ